MAQSLRKITSEKSAMQLHLKETVKFSEWVLKKTKEKQAKEKQKQAKEIQNTSTVQYVELTGLLGYLLAI